MDHKTKLQEVLQQSGDVNIEYRLIKEEGPAHKSTILDRGTLQRPKNWRRVR